MLLSLVQILRNQSCFFLQGWIRLYCDLVLPTALPTLASLRNTGLVTLVSFGSSFEESFGKQIFWGYFDGEQVGSVESLVFSCEHIDGPIAVPGVVYYVKLSFGVHLEKSLSVE